ncbi:hypothetical protein BDY21DRAFT_75109 [Lineolata rhizophorae]|uniref:Uncharacterized protein n=1 Tax=Lineolata rhizophorae TaxID=578093 RepID=A0A6A6NUD9_9PEZI|nr:hypothetical protein BDY21DRAFT_75109 [Lineolata rhizophorae]
MWVWASPFEVQFTTTTSIFSMQLQTLLHIAFLSANRLRRSFLLCRFTSWPSAFRPTTRRTRRTHRCCLAPISPSSASIRTQWAPLYPSKTPRSPAGPATSSPPFLTTPNAVSAAIAAHEHTPHDGADRLCHRRRRADAHFHVHSERALERRRRRAGADQHLARLRPRRHARRHALPDHLRRVQRAPAGLVLDLLAARPPLPQPRAAASPARRPSPRPEPRPRPRPRPRQRPRRRQPRLLLLL